MKPSLQFSVPCLDIQKGSDKPQTFSTVFYELPFPKFPGTIDYFYIINGWCSGKGSFRQAMKIIAPDGHTLVNTGEQMFELSTPEVPMMLINKLEAIEFETPGVYKVQVFLDSEQVLEYFITVRQVAADH